MFSKAEAEKTTSRFSRERKLNPNNGQKDRTERQHLVPSVCEIFYISYSSFLKIFFAKIARRICQQISVSKIDPGDNCPLLVRPDHRAAISWRLLGLVF